MNWKSVNIVDTGNPQMDIQNYTAELNRRIGAIFSTLSYGKVGAAPSTILDAGISQAITIADNDGVNYHHLTFTDGLLTVYAKDATP